MLTAFAVSIFAVLPQADIPCDVVDLVELNHVYSAEGKPIYTQAVFYDWRPVQGEHQVRAWRLLKSVERRPERDFQSGDWVMIFPDTAGLREVRAASFRESWTQYDLEQVERDRLPKEYRPGLLFEREPRN
jgi:hypothetical protein